MARILRRLDNTASLYRVYNTAILKGLLGKTNRYAIAASQI